MGYEFLFDIFFLTSSGSGWVAVEKRDVVGVSREKTKR